jgi:hypothetical protein
VCSLYLYLTYTVGLRLITFGNLLHSLLKFAELGLAEILVRVIFIIAVNDDGLII